MKKFPKTKHDSKRFKLMTTGEAEEKGTLLLSLVVTKFQDILRLTGIETDFVIYSANNMSHVQLKSNSPESKAIYNALKKVSESIILHSSYHAYFYARYAIKKPWPPGEAAIATDPQRSVWYAKGVIKGPWPPGEDAIATNANESLVYANEVIKGRFFLGEKAIASDAACACYYALNVVKGPWPPGEVAISSRPELITDYENGILKPAGASWSIKRP